MCEMLSELCALHLVYSSSVYGALPGPEGHSRKFFRGRFHAEVQLLELFSSILPVKVHVPVS